MNDDFYHSKAWADCRAEYYNDSDGFCERCKARGEYVPGVIVHHKVHIGTANRYNTDVTLNKNNLELLCLACHNEEHFGGGAVKRIAFDEEGTEDIKPYQNDG